MACVVSIAIDRPHKTEEATDVGDSYSAVETPRDHDGLREPVDVDELNDQQLSAYERHEWKRCIGPRNIRWVG